MPRGPRLDAAGPLHHVMVRGIERRRLFLTPADRQDFVQGVAHSVRRTSAAIYAWSPMPNHAHLLLRSGSLGLSAGRKAAFLSFSPPGRLNESIEFQISDDFGRSSHGTDLRKPT